MRSREALQIGSQGNVVLWIEYMKPHLVSPENISCVNLILHIIQTDIVAVGDDGIAKSLKLVEGAYDTAAEERGAVLKRRLIDDDLRSLCLDALHDALNAALAEVVRV